ncbi:hypothetical protein WJX74_010838 [Apatococcus lobatus]|uniref:Cyclin-like domain-containing protein n=1 Tax=Apatococcus lobatus TaxID=904363 RepID=A0AAW1S6M5_9CHLO
MNFSESSQRERWLLTAEDLSKRRQMNMDKAVAAIKASREQTEASASQGPDSQPSKKLRTISLDDEAKLSRFYQSKMQKLCKELTRAFGFKPKVQGTALTFFKRFYLGCSALDHDPKNIMLTCIYLACKVEESYLSAEEFCRMIGQDSSVVLQNELAVLQGVGFDLVVYNPYHPLDGFLQELEAQAAESSLPDLQQCNAALLSKIKASALAAIDALLMTDAPLLHPPGLVATAALRSACKGKLPFDGFFKVLAKRSSSNLPDDQLPHRMAKMAMSLAALDELGRQGMERVPDDQVKKIDKRLKACHNLLLDPDSQAYKDAAAAKASREAERRRTKLADRRAESELASAHLLGSSSAAASRQLNGKESAAAEGPPEQTPEAHAIKRQKLA